MNILIIKLKHVHVYFLNMFMYMSLTMIILITIITYVNLQFIWFAFAFQMQSPLGAILGQPFGLVRISLVTYGVTFRPRVILEFSMNWTFTTLGYLSVEFEYWKSSIIILLLILLGFQTYLTGFFYCFYDNCIFQCERESINFHNIIPSHLMAHAIAMGHPAS